MYVLSASLITFTPILLKILKNVLISLKFGTFESLTLPLIRRQADSIGIVEFLEPLILISPFKFLLPSITYFIILIKLS